MDSFPNWEIERELSGGCSSVCGADEAGRGPLAGPVYAAAVLLPPGIQIEGLNDSKKLSEKRRESLFERICAAADCYSVASASVEEIENLNILQASLLAMRRAVDGLNTRPELVLADGNQVFDCGGIPVRAVVKGDGKCPSIAAASVLAKVSRDRYMREMAKLYPMYGFEQHKGYGTAKHYAALRAYGPCPLHRPLFLRKMH